MARKFWTLLPETYYTYKQHARGGRNEVWFTLVGCAAYYLLYTSFHRKPQPTQQRPLTVNGRTWF